MACLPGRPEIPNGVGAGALAVSRGNGQDQIDYAIYMLEAAERKYQMNLKQAKQPTWMGQGCNTSSKRENG